MNPAQPALPGPRGDDERGDDHRPDHGPDYGRDHREPGALSWDQVEAVLTDLDRLGELATYDLDNPHLRERLDEITARSCQLLGAPVSLVSLVLDSAQFLAGSHGIGGWMKAADGTPVEWSFCARAVASGQPYVVTDAVHDRVQSNNPLVTHDGIAAYAGIPLTTPEGHNLGAHCVISDRPRTFTPDELASLRSAAQEIVDVLREFKIPA